MEILNIGPWELIIFLIIAFLLLGPKGMILTAYKIGQWIRSTVRSPMWREILHYAQEIRELPKKLMDETGLEAEIKEVQKTTNEAMKEVDQSLKEVAQAARVPEAEHLRLQTGQTSVPAADTPSGGKQFIPLATFPSLTESGEVKKLTPEELQAAAQQNVALPQDVAKSQQVTAGQEEEAAPENMAAPEDAAATEESAGQDAAQQDPAQQDTAIKEPQAPKGADVGIPALTDKVQKKLQEKLAQKEAAAQAVPAAESKPSDQPATAADKYAVRRAAIRNRIERHEADAEVETPVESTDESSAGAESQEVMAGQNVPADQEQPARKRSRRKVGAVLVVDTVGESAAVDTSLTTTENVETPALPETPAPRKRATRKKAVVQVVETAEPPVTAEAPLPEAQADEPPAVPAAPAPKRATRKRRVEQPEPAAEKSNGSKPAVLDVAATAEAAQPDLAASEEPLQKPVRRPRKPRVKEE